MGLELFTVTDKNPNDAAGGGGCMCSPVKSYQCTPPYCVFMHTEMLTHLSPVPVLSMSCARRFAGAIDSSVIDRAGVELEALPAPEPEPAPAAVKKSARRSAL